MLSKVSSNTLDVLKYYVNDTFTRVTSSWQYSDLAVASPWKAVKLYVSMEYLTPNKNWEFLVTNTNWGTSTIKDDSNIAMHIYYGSSSYNYTYNWEKTLAASDSLYFRQYSSGTGSTISALIKAYEKLFTISKTVKTHKSKPRQLKSIWEKATSTLYGYHTDNTRYTGE